MSLVQMFNLWAPGKVYKGDVFLAIDLCRFIMAPSIPSTPPRRQQSSCITSNPHTGPSRPLRTRPAYTHLRNLYNQPYAASTLPTRLDFNASREPIPIENHGVSDECSWSVMNSKYELHLSDGSPNIHLPRAHAKIPHSPGLASSATQHQHQRSQQTNIADSSLIPHPLKIGKKPVSWDPEVGEMPRKKSNKKRSISTTALHSRISATENAVEQHLFHLRAQVAELRMGLSLCESTLSQMADQLSQMKPSPTLSSNHHKPKHPIPAPDVGHTGSKPLAFLSSVNPMGVNAQPKRGQKASAI